MTLALNRKGASFLRLACAGSLLLFLVVQATGCNTTQGAGKDVERLGENIQDAAQKAK